MTKNNLQLLSNDCETIVALCTPRGSGAIALIRMSGYNAINIADSLAHLSSEKILEKQSTHTIHHGYVIDSKHRSEIIDEVLFHLMRAPKTFTGQDTVEISCHNNQFIIEKIIECAIKNGARLAQPGEFTKRAFLNKKIDLIQAESINDIINAQTQVALKKAMSQLKGSLSHYFHEIESKLISLLCLIESTFEFLEEEQNDLNINEQIKTKTDELLSELKIIKAHFNQQQQIKQGIRIAIIGSVNAGKSTLFNALLNKNRAIVSKEKGTTRDSIESSMYENGNFWLIIDTAGLRKTGNIIEQQGVERSFQEAASADIILLVTDVSKALTSKEYETYEKIYEKHNNKIIVVLNKIDKQKWFPSIKNISFFDKKTLIINVSAEKNIGIQKLKKNINFKIQNLFSTLQSPFLLNQRQYNSICEIEKKLQTIAKKYSNSIESELISYQLRGIIESISELTGRNLTEEILDKVFNSFCVGK